MKKKFLTLTMALALMFALAVPAFAADFDDVNDGDYFAAPVNWAVAKEVTKGTSSTKFSPKEVCTRAQIITFLWRAAGCPPSATFEFTDLTSDDYFYEAVAWAKDLDMFEGDTFNPYDPCTRQMAVEFMWQAAQSPKVEGNGFTDAKGDAINWAVAAGVTTGTTSTTFSPNETCTRGQIVTFLYRAFADDEQKAADAAAAEKAAAEKAEAEKAEAEKAAAEKAEAEKAAAEKAAAEKAEAEKAAAEKAAAEKAEAEKAAAEKAAAEGEYAIQIGIYVQPGTGNVLTVKEVSYNANTEEDPADAEGFIIIFVDDLETSLNFNGNVAEDQELRITFGEDKLTFEVLANGNALAKFAGDYDFRQPLEGEE